MLNRKEKMILRILKETKLSKVKIDEIMSKVKGMGKYQEDLLFSLEAACLAGGNYVIDILKCVGLLENNYK